MGIGRKIGFCTCHLCKRSKGKYKRLEARFHPYSTEQQFRRAISTDLEFRKLPKGYRRRRRIS